MDLVEHEVGASFADTAVSAAAFAAAEFFRIAVHADQEDVQAGEQTVQLGTPPAELDDVFDDQVIASLGECGQAAVKAGEEPRSDLVPPVEGAAVAAAVRAACRPGRADPMTRIGRGAVRRPAAPWPGSTFPSWTRR
jgi:hypothetical protein